MRPLLALACLALIAATLPGCLEDAERYPNGVSTSSSTSLSATGGSTSTATGSRSATGSSTGPAGNATDSNATNQSPVAGMTATPTNGTAPINVTFQLSGSDPDGDPLNWTLTFGDGNHTNGTALPTSVVHQYASKGNLTAVFTVSDGQASARERVNLTIAGGVAIPAAPSNLCPRDATAGQDGVGYVFDGDGGTWTFVEDNDIPGLQVENNHPTEATGQAELLGEHNGAWEGCENGDQMTS